MWESDINASVSYNYLPWGNPDLAFMKKLKKKKKKLNKPWIKVIFLVFLQLNIYSVQRIAEQSWKSLEESLGYS